MIEPVAVLRSQSILKLAAHPLLILTAFVLPAVPGPDVVRNWAPWLSTVGAILYFWHWTYVGTYVGVEKSQHPKLPLACFGAVLISMIVGTVLPHPRLGMVLVPILALATLILIYRAGQAITRTQSKRSAARQALATLMTFYAPITGIFYFQRLHAPNGTPKCAHSAQSPESSPMPVTLNSEESAFWQRFQDETGYTCHPKGIECFGDSAEMMDDLLALVLTRTKQATACLARWYEDNPASMPKPGDLWIITDGQNNPACVIRTTRVDVMPIHQVDAEFAYVEGEGDRSYEYWITEHRKYWTREAEREGFVYSDDLDVVCERFELVWAPA